MRSRQNTLPGTRYLIIDVAVRSIFVLCNCEQVCHCIVDDLDGCTIARIAPGTNPRLKARHSSQVQA